MKIEIETKLNQEYTRIDFLDILQKWLCELCEKGVLEDFSVELKGYDVQLIFLGEGVV